MKRMLNVLLAALPLIAALLVASCAKPEGPASTPSPTAAPAATAGSSAPAAGPKAASGDLNVAKGHLERAVTEFGNRNNRGAIDYITLARAELTAAAAAATGKTKTDIEAANKDLDSAQTMIEKNEKTAETALKKVTQKVDKLANAAKP
jgi:hypothetical protein